MRNKISLFIPALVGTVLLIGSSVRAAQVISRGAQDPSTEINVTADKLTAEEGSNRIEAIGNVEIKRGGMTLKADEARMNRATMDTEAKGRVTVDDPDWKVKSADSIQMNLEKETGEILNGDLFLEEGHVSMTGRRFQKFGGQTYHVDDGVFTTCLCESGAPSWKFSAEQMDLTLDGVGTIRNGYFYVFDVPVFYLPYGVFPLRTERQTGFLFPQFGQSSKEGFRFIQPFFWAISKSTDATVKFDLETRARIGVLGEFRTLFERDADFRLDAAYFNEGLRKNEQDAVVDRTIADQRIPKDRWSVGGSHRYTIGSDWLTYSDFGVYRDDLFTRELIERFDLPGSQESDLRRSRFGQSQFGLFKNWRDVFFKGQWNFYQDFIQPDGTTFQRTPQITFWGRQLLAGFPLEFRWRAEGVNYLRNASGDGLRLDLRPEVVLPFRLASRFFGSVAVAPRETVYHLYTPAQSSSDKNLSRELVEIRSNIGTSLSRTFGFNSLGLSQVKHVIEPELSYLFVPRTDQSQIPIMDEIDRVNRRNVLTFAVANRLWGKSRSGVAAPDAESDVELLSSGIIGDVRQMASVRLALTYDIDKERKGGDSLSDLDLNVRLTPLTYIDFGFDGGVNPGPWHVTQARARVTVSDPRPILRRTLDPDFNTHNSISMSYHYLRRGPNSFLADNANLDVESPVDCISDPNDPRCSKKDTVGNVGGNLLYHLTDNLLVHFNSTYDARDSRFIGFRVITKFLSFCECWTVTLGLKRDINPAKTSFSFDFSLLGLGSTKSSLKK